MPKEIRKPKSEGPNAVEDVLGQDSAFWNWGTEPTIELLILRDEQPRDLMERTAEFGERIVRFAKKIPHTPENVRLISQLVGAGTSIGANYCEADDSVSGKDFKKSIGTCRKESKETIFFLRMVVASEENFEGRSARVMARSQGIKPDFRCNLEKMK